MNMSSASTWARFSTIIGTRSAIRLKPTVIRGRAVTETQYQDALGVKESAEAFFGVFFQDYDAIIAPSAAGGAPKFGEGTGDPVFCTIWTLAGLPSVSLPLLVSESGLPVGVQLIGGPEEDDRLMRTANWLLTKMKAEA